jgi:hypothetical protein
MSSEGKSDNCVCTSGSVPVTFPYAALTEFAITATGEVTRVIFLLSTNHTSNKQISGTATKLRYGREGIRISAG